ncbi:zinc-finger domain-containing protein [Candidatus Methylopumilus universalis]|uniref:zinc-finger domain-containing protein n=1 Tax=Candidatus Methylopumilus universalis TaxID=2588536 RepID=UPI003BEF24B9
MNNQVISVDKKSLPLFCPTKKENLFSSHPRVFLDITQTGMVSCPYCGTTYKLK